jgi:general secretion pathway protein G
MTGAAIASDAPVTYDSRSSLAHFKSRITMQINNSSIPCASRPAARDAGFSLLELMVVVVIMSILALVVMPRVIDRPDQARVARAQADISSLSSAAKLYKLDNFRYPTTEQGLAALVTRPTTEPVPTNYAQNGYIDRLPKDPWGNDYQYLSPGVHDEFDIFTLGADGVAGGTGLDADIGSWDG